MVRTFGDSGGIGGVPQTMIASRASAMDFHTVFILSSSLISMSRGSSIRMEEKRGGARQRNRLIVASENRSTSRLRQDLLDMSGAKNSGINAVWVMKLRANPKSSAAVKGSRGVGTTSRAVAMTASWT